MKSRKPVRAPRKLRVTTLVVVDERPLKESAWQRLQSARKQLGRSAEKLHRHEEKDEPAYRSWMSATCPVLLSEIRELTQQCQAKSQLISKVQSLSWRHGRPAAIIWQMYKGQLTDESTPIEPEAAENPDSFEAGPDDAIEDILREHGIDPDSPEAELIRDLERNWTPHDDDADDQEAKEIYRRLVQQLHPDRGGEWTRQREALWHEVQQAWAARDADWLARLEAESEIATETLSVQSPLGRLYAALLEIKAARRDMERKLRQYRTSPAWQFTDRRIDQEAVEILRRTLEDERDRWRAHLRQIEETFAKWEKPVGMAKARQRQTPMAAPNQIQLDFA